MAVLQRAEQLLAWLPPIRPSGFEDVELNIELLMQRAGAMGTASAVPGVVPASLPPYCKTSLNRSRVMIFAAQFNLT